MTILMNSSDESYSDYELLSNTNPDPSADDYGFGLARELSRMVLPPNIYTQWYWKTDLHNLFHFLRLRADSHAQYEIRVYAELLEKLVRGWVPSAYEAYEQYIKKALSFSDRELTALAMLINTEHGRILIESLRNLPVDLLGKAGKFSKGEWIEFIEKLDNLKNRFKD